MRSGERATIRTKHSTASSFQADLGILVCLVPEVPVEDCFGAIVAEAVGNPGCRRRREHNRHRDAEGLACSNRSGGVRRVTRTHGDEASRGQVLQYFKRLHCRSNTGHTATCLRTQLPAQHCHQTKTRLPWRPAPPVARRRVAPRSTGSADTGRHRY